MFGLDVDFISLAKSMNYNHAFTAKTKKELIKKINEIKKIDGPVLLEVKINKGSRHNLSRPKTSPKNNKINFMKHLNADAEH